MTFKDTKHMTHTQTQIYQHETMYSTKHHKKPKNQETPQKTTQHGKENQNTTKTK